MRTGAAIGMVIGITMVVLFYPANVMWSSLIGMALVLLGAIVGQMVVEG